MKPLIKIVVFISLFLSTLNANQDLIIGLLYENIFASKKDAKIGSRLWLNQMRDKNYGVHIDIVFYDEKRKLLDDFKNRKISHITSDVNFYYENKKILDELSGLKWIMNKGENIFQSYYLIKNRDSNFNLKNPKVNKIYYSTGIEKVWFESLILENPKKNKTILKKFVKIDRPNKLLFNIFFNKDEVSIITKEMYDEMLNLNPQIKEKVLIVAKSEQIFFGGIGFARKNLPEKIKKVTDTMQVEIKEKPSSFRVLSFVNVGKLHILDESSNELFKLDIFYKKYFKNKRLGK